MDRRTAPEESMVCGVPLGERTGAQMVQLVVAPQPAAVAGPGKPLPDLSLPPRLRTADRQQLLSPMTIDDLLEADHPSRGVWRFCEGLDLTLLYDRIRARGPIAGRPPTDPRILVALWLYATLAGVKSANALADLCIHHDAYFWLAGGLFVNAHTLSDFRVQDGDFLEQMLTHSVSVLRRQGLVDLDRIAQDGVRVRASAGAASFRRRETLEKLLQEAQAEVQRFEQQGDQPSAPEQPEPSLQQRAARRRHAKERVERIRHALARMPEREARKEKTRNVKRRSFLPSDDNEKSLSGSSLLNSQRQLHFPLGATRWPCSRGGANAATASRGLRPLAPDLPRSHPDAGSSPLLPRFCFAFFACSAR